ncbi:hypothetical protein Sliba_56410 [Streptomyces nigrescens]|uniref:Uncharacterized protein n=1 Tax=Streptomyces nigrescens TaxID=1920 RepID=A0A640TNT8_STRNI|nr:hypothetical protein Sliba_56410 [Streptomyces libani subsp. libani]GGW05249.1 hypothetical protein GCM10010500_69140 [Streptomyces libani subsp. libani]
MRGHRAGHPETGRPAAPFHSHHRRRGTAMGKHGDGKGGEEGDRQQSPKESDGQWTKPVTDPPKK